MTRVLEQIPAIIRGTANPDRSLTDVLRLVNAGWVSLVAAAGLTLIGVLAIDLADGRAGAETALAGESLKQAIFALLGVSAAMVVALPHYRIVGVVATPAMIIALLFLVFLLLPGVPSWVVKPRNGTRGWINLGLMDFQPSEVAKIAYVLVVARYMRFRSEHRRFMGLVPLGVMTAIPVGLIVLQPDLGTAMLFAPSLLAMLLAAGAKLRHLTIIVVAAMMAGPAMYPLLRPHQKTRIVALVRQMQGDRTSASDINYQAYTAQTVIGAGGLAGVSEDRARLLLDLNPLPESHNDMVFAVIALRWGFLGAMGVVMLAVAWVVGALWTAAQTKEPFGRLVCVGLAAFVAAQTTINVGMNIGLLPIIGITLPLVSYGGSSMLTVWMMTGLVFNVALHRPRPPFRPSFEWE
ncbi:MAG: FtsW/RodA/SpoVE family cell cycle protein [Phycisphaerales bacterium]|nr:FtsW/RodA/SpoVE family cell cycle protein [Phycisphaerales bacterium]